MQSQGVFLRVAIQSREDGSLGSQGRVGRMVLWSQEGVPLDSLSALLFIYPIKIIAQLLHAEVQFGSILRETVELFSHSRRILF